MLSLTRPLGRLPFLMAVTGVNLVLGLAILLALTFLPSGGGHLAVLIVVAALQFLWFTLHARRFADAGRGATGPGLVFAAGLLIFVVGYLTFAALWSSPEVQREAFRTAGGIGGAAFPLHVESNALILDTGRAFAQALGLAGAIVVSGLIVLGFGLAALLSGVFTIFALFLPSRLPSASANEPTKAFQRR